MNSKEAIGSRRDFFSLFQTSNTRMVLAGAEVYTQALTLVEVFHLLKRTTFSLDVNFAKTLVGKTASQAVDILFENAAAKSNPQPPHWWQEALKDPNADQEAFSQNFYKIVDQNKDLQRWWIGHMQEDNNSVLEKLTLFWHGHFTSQYTVCDTIPAQLMYRQNALFRSMFNGDLRTFLEKVTLDGAMLMYLNGGKNIKDAPNENYARELLELFSVGIGAYTEEDVRGAARVLTGWRINSFDNGQRLHEAYLQTGYFDTDAKTIFGEQFDVNYEITEQNVLNNSIKRLIDVIIKKKGDAVAEFITTKLYKFFVYSNPDELDQNTIKSLAQGFQSSNFNLEVLVKSILKSAHFFDPENRGIQIKSPAENVIGFTKHFEVTIEQKNNLMKELGLELLNPPNVAGWRGYRSWVTTKTLPLSIKYITQFLNEQDDAAVATWVEQFEGYYDSYLLTEAVCSLFLGRLPSEERVNTFMLALLGDAPYYEWPNILENKNNAGFRIKALLKEIIKAPDYYVL